jgi:hypothetical protein
MKQTVAIYLADLAGSLAELRRRFRQAARLEVARAVGETLQELALTAILGDARSARRHVQEGSSWGDPWQDDFGRDPWQSHGGFSSSFEENRADQDGGARAPAPAPALRSAFILGLGAVRMAYRHTSQPMIAIVVGAILVIVVLVGGPTIEAFAEAWATANDLVGFPVDRLS